MIPKITDMAPARISHHSLSISLRSLIAPMISKMPCTIAHAPMKTSSTSAVIPGHKKVARPAAMPASPTTISHQVGTGFAPPVKAAIKANAPSTNA